ncbi:hypothetical protein JHW43_008632 [Diplocarpon mali]|nr:hypothetical protein JHW43_008632 [Diplocarpon mali]
MLVVGRTLILNPNSNSTSASARRQDQENRLSKKTSSNRAKKESKPVGPERRRDPVTLDLLQSRGGPRWASGAVSGKKNRRFVSGGIPMTTGGGTRVGVTRRDKGYARVEDAGRTPKDQNQRDNSHGWLRPHPGTRPFRRAPEGMGMGLTPAGQVPGLEEDKPEH